LNWLKWLLLQLSVITAHTSSFFLNTFLFIPICQIVCPSWLLSGTQYKCQGTSTVIPWPWPLCTHLSTKVGTRFLGKSGAEQAHIVEVIQSTICPAVTNCAECHIPVFFMVCSGLLISRMTSLVIFGCTPSGPGCQEKASTIMGQRSSCLIACACSCQMQFITF